MDFCYCTLATPRPWVRGSYLFIVFLLILIQKVNGADPVPGFVVPRVVCHVVHQTLQGSEAGEIIRACDRLLTGDDTINIRLTLRPERVLECRSKSYAFVDFVQTHEMKGVVLHELTRKRPDHSFKSRLSHKRTATPSSLPPAISFHLASVACYALISNVIIHMTFYSSEGSNFFSKLKTTTRMHTDAFKLLHQAAKEPAGIEARLYTEQASFSWK